MFLWWVTCTVLDLFLTLDRRKMFPFWNSDCRFRSIKPCKDAILYLKPLLCCTLLSNKTILQTDGKRRILGNLFIETDFYVLACSTISQMFETEF